MAGNRKAAEKQILEDIEALLPGSPNTQMYREQFMRMSDKAFDDWMKGIEDGSIVLSLISPNHDKIKLNVKRNLALAKKWGHEFFERLWINPGNDIPPYLSNRTYLVFDWSLRRQAQLLTKKISIPEDNRSLDDFTGQPTGKSKGSKMPYPQIQIMASLNMEHALTEVLKTRGGDLDSYNAMKTMIHRTGTASQEAIKPYGGVVKSTQTLHTLLTCMHFESTLL